MILGIYKRGINPYFLLSDMSNRKKNIISVGLSEFLMQYFSGPDLGMLHFITVFRIRICTGKGAEGFYYSQSFLD
jgi:hypothetical protein